MHISILRPFVNRSPINKFAIRIVSTSSDVNNTANLKPWTEIPGPKSYPFIGPLFSFFSGGELHKLSGGDLTQELFRKYGPIVKLDRMLDKPRMIFLFDAESSAQILRGENTMPIRPGMDSLVYYRKNKKNSPPGQPTGLVSDHGEAWQEFRSTVNPVLLHPKTMRLYTSAIDEVALEMVERLRSRRDEKNMIPRLDREMNLWSLESIGVVALGCRMKCFDESLDKDSPVQQLIDVVQNIMKASDELDIKPSLWKFYPTKMYKKAMDYYKKQEILARHFIDNAIKEIESNPKPNDEKGVLEKLLDINKDVALIMASDMLLAGVDTVANSALGALYLLGVNPDKQSKLRAELKSNEAKRSYLKACVKEAIRMMPVASGNLRKTTKDYAVLGYKILKGTHIGLAHQNMSRMDKYFLKSNEFIPERWIVDKNDPLYYRNAHPFAYNPFGFGTRACIGRRIAEMEMETFIGRVIESFEIEWFGPPPKVEQTALNYVIGPYNFIFKDVKN